MNVSQKRGISLYLVIVILAILMSVSLGLISLTVGEIQIAGGVGNSTVAFYAADTGIEKALYDKLVSGGAGQVSGTLDNGANYSTEVQEFASSTKIYSTGNYRGVWRKIEINLSK